MHLGEEGEVGNYCGDTGGGGGGGGGVGGFKKCLEQGGGQFS